MQNNPVVNQCPNCGAARDLGTWRCRSCGQSIPRTVIDPNQKIMIREYADRFQYQQDAAKLSIEGWRVTAVNESRQNAGCLRLLTLGLISLVVRPKDHFIVTYNRD